MSDPGDSLQDAIVDGAPPARDVEGRRLLASLRAKMFGDVSEEEPLHVGRYRIDGRLGQGGMGVVFEAYDPVKARTVALKVVRPGPGARRERPARLLREAEALAVLDHPNVVPIFDAGRDGDQVFLAMERITGKTLDQWQAVLRPWRQVVAHYLEAGRGLAAVHAAGLVHRDFKPANIMLADDGRVLVMDFGLVSGLQPGAAESGRGLEAEVVARLREAATSGPEPLPDEVLTRSGQVVGSYSFMAPEQHQGRAVDALSDQFSYCAAFLEALQGEFPFVGDTPAELYAAKCEGRFVTDPPRTRVPARLRAALLRGLSADPGARWSDLPTLLAEVERSIRLPLWIPIAVGVGAVGAFGVIWPLDPGVACAGELELDRAWTDATRSAIRSSVVATGLGHAPETAPRVVAALDAYATSWSAARDHACGAAGDEVERACLRRRRRALVTTVELASTADPSWADALLDVVTALPDPTRCADDATTTWPHDAPAQDALWSIRRALVRADLLGRTGHLVRPVQVLGDAEEHALTLDSYAVLAEVEVAVGDAERRAGRTASAGSILSEAHAQAMQTHHLDAAAAAATSLVLVHVAMPARARAWADDATAAILEGGDSPTAAARLAAAVGTVAAQAGPDNGVFADDEVVGALEAAILRFDGEPHGEVARSLAVLADIAESRSRWEEAEAYRRRALDAVLAFAGPRHPDVADAHVRLAAVLVRRGNADAAGNALTAAEAIAGDGTVPSTPNRTELARRIAAVRADLEAAPDR